MDLIPNLPNDVALECFLRLSYHHFPNVSSVCKAWNNQILLPQFRRLRISNLHTQKLVLLSQARLDPNGNPPLLKPLANPTYKLTLLELGSGRFLELPPIPGFSDGLPLFCQVAAAGLDLVVIGGLDPVTWVVSGSVFVFNFVHGSWRRGTEMPGVRRSFFGCASDGDRMVYVAGGHDGDKNALRSAMAYDVESDEWAHLPDMSRERDECKGVFHRGRFHVVGGYCTQTQGRFERSAEVFDVDSWRWGPVEDDFLLASTSPRTCTGGGEGEDLYMCHEGDVVARKGDGWQAVSKLPAEACNVAYVATWQGKLLVIGSARFGEPHVAYVLDLKSYKWTSIERPKEFSGHVQSGCYLEI